MKQTTQGFILLLLALAPTWARAGWDRGNAGDTFVAEFILTGRDVVQRLDLLFENNKPVFDTGPLRAAIEMTEVVSEEHVYLDGFERDAVNYAPDQRLIKVNRSRWRDLRRPTDTKERLRLVLHEYLWISGVNDTNFATSEHLIELLNITNYSPNMWWNPVNPVNYMTATLSVAPEGCSFAPAKFDTKNGDETLVMQPTGNCGDAFRKVRVVKTAGITPVSSNIRGMFHKFDITVFGAGDREMGAMTFEPEWASCLLPEKGSCRVSGKMTVGGVELVFWFLRN